LGTIDVRGAALLSLLIRTLVWKDDPSLGSAAARVVYRVGSGITYASDPRLEEAEALDKGRLLAQALCNAAPEAAESCPD
jgi:anthranilate/para-aminobenzoate synthase component I